MKTAETSTQTGAVMLLLLGLVSIFLALSALVIDLNRARHTLQSMQRAVDAAALAGASQLVLTGSSDMERWKNAKRAALALLKQNPIFGGYALPDPAKAADRQPPVDECEKNGDYSTGIYDNRRIRIEIERGVYAEENAEPFTSSESTFKCLAESAPGNPAPNAMRVKMTLSGFYLAFGKIVGQEQINRLSVTGLAARSAG